MSAQARTDTPVPYDVVQAVESYIRTELRETEEFSNREPFDYSGTWSLHRLAADIYAKGFDAGCQIEAERQRQQQLRERDRMAKSDA